MDSLEVFTVNGFSQRIRNENCKITKSFLLINVKLNCVCYEKKCYIVASFFRNRFLYECSNGQIMQFGEYF